MSLKSLGLDMHPGTAKCFCEQSCGLCRSLSHCKSIWTICKMCKALPSHEPLTAHLRDTTVFASLELDFFFSFLLKRLAFILESITAKRQKVRFSLYKYMPIVSGGLFCAVTHMQKKWQAMLSYEIAFFRAASLQNRNVNMSVLLRVSRLLPRLKFPAKLWNKLQISGRTIWENVTHNSSKYKTKILP